MRPENRAEQTRLHRRKMVAPVVISVLVILYYAAYFVERIREIKKGEEDDLSHY